MYTRRRQTLFAISLVIFLIVALHYVGVLLPVENIFRSIINRGSSLAYTKSVTVAGQTFETVEDLQAAYTVLLGESNEYKAARAQLFDLIEQNEQLREQLEFLEGSPYTYLGADIIGKNVDPIANTLIINRGSSSGISVGDPVIVYDGILLGKIIRSEANTSIIRLLRDGQSKVAATVLNTDHSIGLVEGGYGVSVQMNFIPENEEISLSDQIITSGLEQGIPRGLLIGTVEATKKEVYEPFQQAVVTLPVDIDGLSTVVVITSEGYGTDI